MTAAKLTSKKSTRPHVPKKIESPQILDQSEGYKVYASDQFDQTTEERIDELIKAISSQNVCAQFKFDVMQGAVETCPKVNMVSGRKKIPSMFDSGSQVT